VEINVSSIDRELEELRKIHGGVLRPKDVLEFARNPKTHLHQCFGWDDAEVIRRWLLRQARQLVRVQSNNNRKET